MRISYEESKEYEEYTTEDFFEDEYYEDVYRKKKTNKNIIEWDPLDFETTFTKEQEEQYREQCAIKDVIDIFDVSDNILVKVIEYGPFTDVITSYNRTKCKGLQKVKNLPKGQYKNLETGSIRRKKKNRYRSDCILNLKRSVRELKRLIILNFGDLNGYFITLSYDYSMYNINKAVEDYKKFYSKFIYYYGKCKNTRMTFIKVLEPTLEGNWHFHLLVKGDKNNNLKISKEKIAEMWGCKNVYICPIIRARELLAKMRNLNRNLYQERNSISVLHDVYNVASFYNIGTKLFTCSQNLKRPAIKIMSRKEANERLLNYKKIIDNSITVKSGIGVNAHTVNVVRHETYKK